MSYHGKKIGTLEIKLDRKKNRYQSVTLDIDLRLDIQKGMFWAEYEGAWYSADTKDGLAAQIKVVATKALSIEWKRYIRIDYEAEGFPIEDEKSGRPATNGQYHTFDLTEDRSKFGQGRDENDPFAICAIKLHWTLIEVSEPYTLPENPEKRVRAQRAVDVWGWGEDKGTEKIGDPEEWNDDILPTGLLLWTPEREALLVEIIAALGKLDQRLLGLFTGDPKQLAAKIDAAVQLDPSRLLAAPSSSKPRRRA